MSDGSSFDIGSSWLGQGASWLGNQISSGVDSIGNLFGSGDSSAAASSSPAASSNFIGQSLDASGIGGYGAPSLGATAASTAFVDPATSASPTSALSYGGAGANPESVMTNSGPGGANAPSASNPATPSPSSSILQDLLGTKGAGNFNPLGTALSTAGLGYNLLEGSPTADAEKQIKQLAASQSGQGQQLEGYINNGTLPPGAQTWVDNQTAAQSAAIKAKYANLGMSGSTAETQELNNVQAQATAQIFQIANTLLQTGISETGASSQLYQYLMSAQGADQQQVSSAIQNFVSSLGGGSGSTQTVKLTV